MSPDADKLASAFGEADEAVDLSDVMPEAWLALAFFWLLGLTVLYQFITRYVFNDSAAWTEEIARYFLIATVFLGAVIGVAKNNHIQVDFFYRFLPKSLARAMALANSGLSLWVPDSISVKGGATRVPPTASTYLVTLAL